jgi:hypothetical protein
MLPVSKCKDEKTWSSIAVECIKIMEQKENEWVELNY